MKKSTFSATDISILAAFCMFLSIIEFLIPKPLPFMRIGLANVPILLSLVIFPVRGTLLLTLLKILGQGLVNGTLFSYIFLFSAAGSFSSSIVMIAVFYLLKNRVSLIGVGIAGAMASNIVQILLAREFIFGKAAILIAPPFLVTGLISAFILGLFTVNFISQSEWVRERPTAAAAPAAAIDVRGNTFSRFLFFCGIITIPAFIFQSDVYLKVFMTLFFMFLSSLRGKKFRLLPNLIMAAGIIAANLLTPHGKILLEIGGFKITAGALEGGINKAALIIGLIYISRSSVRSGLNFPGRLGSILSLVFYYFEQLTEGERIVRKNIFRQLDNRLIALSALQNTTKKDPESAERRPGPRNYITAAVPMLLTWLIFAAGLIIKY